ncbi:MAG: methylmalonyl-CoA epimerase [Saprospiraceae bacterium]
MLKLDHIGIAVKNLAVAREVYTMLLNQEPYKKETIEDEKVTTLFFNAGNTKIELLEATDEHSVIRKFIEKRGEGLHHIALEVEDIYIAIEEYKKKGFQFINEKPHKGADNKLIVFIKPRMAHGVLVELCQTIK